MQYTLKIKSPVTYDVKNARRDVYKKNHRRCHPPAPEIMAKRRWRRAIKRSMHRINNNPELYNSECFNVPVFTEWNLW